MLLELSSGWKTEVERGPDWLFVKLLNPPEEDAASATLAETLWDLMQQHLLRRVVLEVGERVMLRSSLVGEIVQLNSRIRESGGLLRLCGLSDRNQEALKVVRLDAQFPRYANREEALMHRPMRPR